jgi:hypothetical protein
VSRLEKLSKQPYRMCVLSVSIVVSEPINSCVVCQQLSLRSQCYVSVSINTNTLIIRYNYLIWSQYLLHPATRSIITDLINERHIQSVPRRICHTSREHSLVYIDITKHTYIRSWMLTDIMARYVFNLTMRGPCIVMYSYNKSQRDALFLKFIW